MLIVLCGQVPAAQAKEEKSITELPAIEAKLQLHSPAAVDIFMPRLSKGFAGLQVRMTFKIDKNGKPYAIRYPLSFDEQEVSLGIIMAEALKKWRFKPARDSLGKVHAVKVALPVKVVPGGNGNIREYAQVSCSEPVLLAVLD